MKKKNYGWIALILNPGVVALYGIGCYFISFLAEYGGVAQVAPIILTAFGSLALWFCWCIYQYQKAIKPIANSYTPSTDLEEMSKLWVIISSVALLLITVASGFSIYESGTHLRGELSHAIYDIIETREIEFVHDHLYEDGLDGLFVDIQTELDLPEELYLSNDFDLTVNKNGQITSLESFLYGLNEDSETETFLIEYDSSKSNDIKVRTNGYTETSYDEAMKLQPFLNRVKLLPIKETVAEWNEESFDLYYAGYRSWGYNSEGVVYFDEMGNVVPSETASEEVVGYMISVYASDNDSITPVRFVNTSTEATSSSDADVTVNQSQNDTETFFLSEKQGYQLTVVDAAAGSKFYTLNKTFDAGNTWKVINADPFSGFLGVSSGITFITNELGFIGLSRSGGSYADLYRTADGGKTFEQVELPTIEVPLTETEMYAPFDFPEMPYEENGTLFLPVGQGQDGDYNGGSNILYTSTDKGETWDYVEKIQ